MCPYDIRHLLPVKMSASFEKTEGEKTTCLIGACGFQPEYFATAECTHKIIKVNHESLKK